MRPWSKHFAQPAFHHLLLTSTAVEPALEFADTDRCRSVSGCFTRMVRRVPGPKNTSVNPQWRNSASASTAAS